MNGLEPSALYAPSRSTVQPTRRRPTIPADAQFSLHFRWTRLIDIIDDGVGRRSGNPSIRRVPPVPRTRGPGMDPTSSTARQTKRASSFSRMPAVFLFPVP